MAEHFCLKVVILSLFKNHIQNLFKSFNSVSIKDAIFAVNHKQVKSYNQVVSLCNKKSAINQV